MSVFINGHNGFIGRRLLELFDTWQGGPGLAPPDPPKAIVHLANRRSGLTVEQVVRDNLVSTAYLVDYCRHYKVHLIYISSYSVYKSKAPFRERDLPIATPGDIYGASKIAAEALVQTCPWWTILRPSNVYGPGDCDPSKILPTLVRSHLTGERIEFNLNHTRDYVHVDDLCSLIEAVAAKGPTCEIYNASSGWPISNSRLLKLVEGCKLKPNIIPNMDKSPDVRYADNDRARCELNWKLRYPKLEDGLYKTLTWLQENCTTTRSLSSVPSEDTKI